MEWRITGVRRWLPVLLLASTLTNAALRAVDASDPATATVGDLVALVVAGVLTLVALLWAVTVWRTRVALTPSGLVVRRVRERLVPYASITRVYRDRFASGAVTLFLDDARTVVLPAPVAGVRHPGSEVDDAVEQIRARLPASAG